MTSPFTTFPIPTAPLSTALTTVPGTLLSRAQIPNVTIDPTLTFMVSGFTTAGDLGAGAIYTGVGATSGGPMAIQDQVGTWFNLVVYDGIDVGWYGAKGDWNGTSGTDDTVALQAAFDASSGSGLFAAALIRLPPRAFYVTAPLRMHENTRIVGSATDTNTPIFGSGTKIIASTVNPWPVNRGVIETHNYADISGSADWWHNGTVENISVWPQVIGSPNTYQYGFCIHYAGEQSLVRRCVSNYAGIAGFLITGSPAVLQVEDSSAWNSPGYGAKLTNSPIPGQSGAINNTQKDGSVRFFGFSGDGNATAHMYTDGSMAVGLYGLKCEIGSLGSGANLCCILIDGPSGVTTRTRWEINGFRWESGTLGNTNKDFIRIIGSAQPHLVIGAGAAYNAINLVNDTVNGTTIPVTYEMGHSILWDTQVPVDIHARQLTVPPYVIYQDITGANQCVSTYINNVGSPNFIAFQVVAFSTPAFYYAVTKNTTGLGFASAPKVWSVDFDSGDGFQLWRYTGSVNQWAIRLESGGIKIGQFTSDPIGFYGQTPTTKQTVTGAKGGNAALTSLMTALANLGLVVDSTT